MVVRLLSKMDMQLRNKGFTILELLLVLAILAVLSTVSASLLKKNLNGNIYLIMDDIVFKQFEAIYEDAKTIYDEYDTYITFNRKGGINHADTYNILGYDVIVSLGTGRVYIHDAQQGNDLD